MNSSFRAFHHRLIASFLLDLKPKETEDWITITRSASFSPELTLILAKTRERVLGYWVSSSKSILEAYMNEFFSKFGRDVQIPKPEAIVAQVGRTTSVIPNPEKILRLVSEVDITFYRSESRQVRDGTTYLATVSTGLFQAELSFHQDSETAPSQLILIFEEAEGNSKE